MKEILEEARTVAIKACTECHSGLLDRDRFCRWCGVRQPGLDSSTINRAPATQTNEGRSSFPMGATVAIDPGQRTDVYRKVSGPLVNAVVTGALPVPSAENHSAFLNRIVLALISIPIWLIIVLLSPLDAYAAVKNLARQV